jgi:hypothetical protein
MDHEIGQSKSHHDLEGRRHLHHRVQNCGRRVTRDLEPAHRGGLFTLEQPQMSFANPRCGNLSKIFRRNLWHSLGVSAAWRLSSISSCLHDRWDDDGENIIEHLAGVEDQLPVPAVAAR